MNLALKTICAAKNVEREEVVYEERGWTSDIAKEAMDFKNFIMNHSMKLAMLNDFVVCSLEVAFGGRNTICLHDYHA